MDQISSPAGLGNLCSDIVSAVFIAPLYTDFYRKFRPDSVRKSGQAVSRIIEWYHLTAAAAVSCCSQEKNTIRNAIRPMNVDIGRW
jgi:hypothetical protein